MTTPTTVNIRLQLRADTAANWAAANPTLLANEVGLETDTKKLKVGNGSTAWNSLAYFPSIVSGGTVLGNLEIGSTGTLTFEGSTADGFETTLAVTNPTADRTITLPNQSGTVVVSGNASIVDADIAANAEIAVSKLANGTANQVIVTDGTNVSWSDNLTLAGDLTVNGTTTTVNSETLLVKDKNIEMGVVDTPTDSTADGGGITLKGATDKTINWIDATDAWTSSERFSVPLGSAASPSLTFTGDENSGVYSPGADQVAVATNGTGKVFINSDGKVSVGTSADLGSQIIQAAGGSSATARILISNSVAGVSETAALDFAPANNITGGQIICTAEEDFSTSANRTANIAFYTRKDGTLSEKLRITSAGLVGIGTSTPGVILAASINSSAEWTSSENLGGSTNVQNTLLSLHNNNNTITGVESTLLLSAGSSGTAQHSITCKKTSATVGDLIFRTRTGGGSTSSELMRLTGSGRLGIGTTSPGAYNVNVDDLVIATSGNTGITIASSTTGLGQIAFADGTTTADAYRGLFQYNHSSNAMSIHTDATERLRIDSSGRLLVGTSNSADNTRLNSKISIVGTSNNQFPGLIINGYTGSTAANAAPFIDLARSRGTTDGSYTEVVNNDTLGYIVFRGADGAGWSDGATIIAQADGDWTTSGDTTDSPGRLVFSTTADGASSPTERMRIQENGAVTIGKSSRSTTVAGIVLEGDGLAGFTRSANAPGSFNRQTDDGVIINLLGQNVVEGTISVSGTTVSYNGAHLSRWSQIPGIDPYNKAVRPEILRGTVMSNLDEMCDWTCPTSGDCQDNEQLNKTKISDVEGDKNVAGIFQSWDDDDDTWVNDYYLAMTGDFVIRIAADVTVERGDLLMSAGDGTAKPQDDDIIRSKTIAKVTSTNVSCTYDDGSYCVPCVLMAC